MLSQLLNLIREYHKAEEEIYERVVFNIESRNSLVIFLIFFIAFVSQWLLAILDVFTLKEVINNYRDTLIFVPYLTSYFCFYLGSKFVFRPTDEELKDHTSIIPMFSACKRKAKRGLISFGLSILQTLIFILYLIYKDTEFPNY